MTSKTFHETYLPQLSQCHVLHTSFIPASTGLGSGIRCDLPMAQVDGV
jgi:hypothetical protein